MTDKQTEALKLALEALNSFPTKHLTPFISSARTAIREALAEPSEALASEASEESSGVAQPTQQEPDLSRLKPATQKQIKEWIADGTFVERAIGAMQEQEAENMRLEKMCAEQPAQPQQEPADFVLLLREAEEIVREKPTWKRFIDGTPLANDIAVWMTVFAQDVARRTSPPAQHKPLEGGQIRALWEQEAKPERSTAHFFTAFARAIEAAHGIYATTELKENT